jgi:hypothetical protein
MRTVTPISDSVESFALDLTSVSSTTGLARRLADGCPTAKDRAELAFAAEILGYEEQGLTRAKVIQKLGPALENKYLGFLRTKKFRVYRKFLAEQQATDGDQLAAEQRRIDRQRYDAHAQNALKYFDQAYRVTDEDVLDPKTRRVLIKKGEFVDLDRAERASLLVAKSQGWTEPLPSREKPKELKSDVIQQAMQAIAATDRRETVVRITERTIEVGSRETAMMGGAE